MANKDNPSGFSPIGPILSSNDYVKSTAAAIYPGDMVIFTTVAAGAGGKVAVATAGNTQVVGVALQYRSATDTSILVADDPDQQYYGQVATTTIPTGVNVDILATAGNATRLKSQMELKYTGATMATAQCRVLDRHPNDAASNNSRHRFIINEHAYAKKLTGA